MSKIKLNAVIENGRNKLCSLCLSSVHSSNYKLEDGKFKGREFYCPTCKSNYWFERLNKKFVIMRARYTLPEYKVDVQYKDYTGKSVNKFTTLPYKNDPLSSYLTYSYDKQITIEKKLPFPISSEELEEKISLYITFL